MHVQDTRYDTQGLILLVKLAPEEVKKGNVPVITSVLKAENDPIPFALTLVLSGENSMVKRAALALVCNLGKSCYMLNVSVLLPLQTNVLLLSWMEN